MSSKEAAKKMECSVAWIRQLLSLGKLEGLKINERAWLVNAKSLERYMRDPPSTGRPRAGFLDN